MPTLPTIYMSMLTLCLSLKQRMADRARPATRVTLWCHCKGFRRGLFHQTHVPSRSLMPPSVLCASRKKDAVAGRVPRQQSQEEIYTHKHMDLATWAWG